MKVAVLEVRYAGGLELTDYVLVKTSSRLTLSPRLSALLGILEKSERRITMRIKVDGVTYRVECKQDGEYVVGARLSLGERWLSRLRLFEAPTESQRRLNGRFAHLLSAWALIGAGYLVYATKTWDVRVIIETVLLCFISLTLFVVGHICFSDVRQPTR
ncbi:hypothetical protein AWB82_06897 [Caballeronia glebae]|uniref:Uncharacterized protein n=1 Tax=Caballeronia glebae TaxID=1777143 RepID=A0A158DL07_9BURK|nr:hypothetical protein [Caballeronia glebae]SAK95299.1 hypothetical protein AWB82_06897 [Caballeronia glebae]